MTKNIFDRNFGGGNLNIKLRNYFRPRLGSGSVLEPRCCTNDVRGGAQCLRDGSGRWGRPRNCQGSLGEE